MYAVLPVEIRADTDQSIRSFARSARKTFICSRIMPGTSFVELHETATLALYRVGGGGGQYIRS